MPYQTNFKLRRGYQALLICFVVLVVYYPTLSAEVCLLDDQSMLNDMLNAPPFDLKALFLPGSGGGGYYRPLIGLSYFFDRFAWGLSHEIMHFENILFHLSNSLLVFGIGCALAGYVALAPAVPLLSALLFALHPLATESVNWISGRTDLLAGAFVFAAAFCVLRFPRRGILIPSLLLVIVGDLPRKPPLPLYRACCSCIEECALLLLRGIMPSIRVMPASPLPSVPCLPWFLPFCLSTIPSLLFWCLSWRYT
jgi:hypothetical protein